MYTQTLSNSGNLQFVLLILGWSKLLQAGKELPVFHHNLILLQVQAACVEDFQTSVPSSPLHVSRQLVVHLQDLTEDVVAVDIDVVVAVVDLDAVDLDLGHRLGVVDEVK